MKNKQEAKKIKPLWVGAVGGLALIYCQSLRTVFTTRIFHRNCFNVKLEKSENLSAQPKNLSAVFDKVCVSFSQKRLIRLFSAATKQIGEKLVSKFATKLSKKFNSAI